MHHALLSEQGERAHECIMHNVEGWYGRICASYGFIMVGMQCSKTEKLDYIICERHLSESTLTTDVNSDATMAK